MCGSLVVVSKTNWAFSFFLSVAFVLLLSQGSRALAAAASADGRSSSTAPWYPSSSAASPAFDPVSTASPGSKVSFNVLLKNNSTLRREKASDPTTRPRPRRNVTLPILALLDLSSSGGTTGDTIDGSSLLNTAQMAVAHVNAQGLIPGFQLKLLVNDSKVTKNK